VPYDGIGINNRIFIIVICNAVSEQQVCVTSFILLLRTFECSTAIQNS